MSPAERSLEFHVVTSAPARTQAFASLLGEDRVKQVKPHFTEDNIRKPVNSQHSEWPVEMAEHKAFQDISSLLVQSYLDGVVNTGNEGDIFVDGKRIIRLYSDTINIAYAGDMSDDTTQILEKPKDLKTWIVDRERGAMALSGKHTELCSAITAIDMTNPHVTPNTVLVRTTVKMKPFTPDDVKQFVQKHGEQAIMKSASGISFINSSVELFDTNYPLRTYIQTDPNLPPSLAFELPTWGHLSREDRVRILYGAIPEAIQQLITNFPAAKPSGPSRSTADRYQIPMPPQA